MLGVGVATPGIPESHLALPVLAATARAITPVALPLFRAEFAAGVKAVMGGHRRVVSALSRKSRACATESTSYSMNPGQPVFSAGDGRTGMTSGPSIRTIR